MTENSTHASQIPVVDFGAFSVVHKEIPQATDPVAQDLIKRLYSACSTTGFVYLTNHGISQDEINRALQTLATFFALEPEKKAKCKKQEGNPCGWDELEGQKLNAKRPGRDLKESFDIVGNNYEKIKFPDGLIPMSTLQALYDRLENLSLRVLRALAIGLDADPDILISAHKEFNRTKLRFNYYPKITDDMDVIPGQIRCGEHTDFGTITLLLQDDAGGLEIATQEGSFIPVVPIPGTILLNIANIMQRWTSDRLRSAVHRVVVPEAQLKSGKSRQSIAFFLNPDDEAIIKCLDGSDKYPPIRGGEYVKDLIKISY